MLDFVTRIKQLVPRPHGIYHSSLQVRFLLRVLLPPFLILLIIIIVTYVVISETVRNSVMDDLQRATATTAAKLEREFALRQTILRSTGTELFATKSEYRDKRSELDKNYAACREFLRTSDEYTTAPDDACKPFYAQIAVARANGTGIQQAVDDGYATKAQELSVLEKTTINARLKAVVEFFPETSQVLVVDNSHGIVSRADSGKAISDAATKRVDELAAQALERSVEAEFVQDGDLRKIVFAYPLEEGAVIAVYSLDNEKFLYPSWKSAPIDNSKAYVVVADSQSGSSYPKLNDTGLYKPVLDDGLVGRPMSFSSSGVEYLATSERIGESDWRVIVASPSAIALETLANAQIIAVAVVGLLLVSFLLVGSRFVRRTVNSILGLVGGAVIFSGGGLDHRINASKMSDKEFAQLADTMNHMAIKIQEAEAAIDQKNKEFINVATHEIKAPITAIIGNLSMMLDDGMGAVDETARDLSTQAYKGTIRLRDLVNELLDIARLESGRTRFDLVQLDLVSEIRDMIEVQKTPAGEKGIQIQYQSPANPIMVAADKTKLEIVLTNFISNGIKYNRPQGKLSISHQVKGTTVQISVQDTGLGIPAEQQAKMFQKFFRVEGSDRANIPGTGLGMFITKQFVEGMGGKLWFDSESGKGTTFYFTLPLASGDEAKPLGQAPAGKS